MKVSKRDIVLLIALAGVLIAVCSYFFVYRPFGEKTTALENENVELEKRVAELQELKDNEPIYIEQTAAMAEEIEKIYNEFPVDVRTEDAIMLAVDLANSAPLEVQSISLSSPVELYEVGKAQKEAAAAAATAAAAQEAAAAAEEGTEVSQPPAEATAEVPATQEAAKVLYSKETIITYQASYDALKNGLTQILGSPSKRAIGGVTASFDEGTGKLTASTDVSMLYLTGTNKEYVPPVIPFIPQGRDNIFGTVTTE